MRSAFLFVTVFCICTIADANLGIDFGSDFIKAAGPHGGNTVDIVLNERSHRKTDNYIGFRSGDRYIGDQAKALAARFPLNMVTVINQLMGITYNSTSFEDFKKLEYEFETRREKDNIVGFSFGGQDGEYTVEELYAMMLHYCQIIAENDGVSDPKNVVITIPFHSPLAKRQAVLEAARMVGLNVMGLMHSTTAAALYYGVRRRGFENKTVNLLVYDIGSTHTEVGIYKFTPPVQQTGKKIKSVDSFGTLTTMAVVGDTFLGGRAFDLCIARLLEKEAMEKMKIGNIIGGKTMAERKSQFSLLRAARKAREVLSANSKTPVTVEGIVPERDFHTEMTRKDFEDNCSELFKRVPKVAEEAIKMAGLDLKEIDAFEMMGGTSRTPKILTDLSTLLGRDVDRTLNSDEAAALGAAYYGLRLSPFYRVLSFRVVEHLPFRIFFSITPTLSNFSVSKRVLVENPIVGSRKSITLNRTDDFSIQLFDSQEFVGEISVTGVKEALELLRVSSSNAYHPNNTHIVRIQLLLNESGLFEVEEADIIFRYAVNVSTKAKVNTTAELSNASEEVNEVVKMKRKTMSVFTKVRFVNPSPLGDEDFQRSRKKIFDILEKERRKHDAATAKNNLETYVFWVKREGVLENTTFLSLLSEVGIDRLKGKLSEIEGWLEDGEGGYDTCTKEEYEKKLEELKDFVRQGNENMTGTNNPQESGDDSVKGDL